MRMILDPKRNDPCVCLSGKKYKKCCLDKHNAINDFEGITITGKKIPAEHYQDGRTELPEKYFLFFEEIDYYPNQNITPSQRKELNIILATLEKWHQTYPQHPVILFCIHLVHYKLDNEEIADAFLDKMNKDFPHYIRGRLQYVSRLLYDGKVVDSFAFIGEHVHSLKDMMPTRTIFDLDEANCFHKMLIKRAMRLSNVEDVFRHYKNLVHIKQTVPESSMYEDCALEARDIIRKWTFTTTIAGIEQNLFEKGLLKKDQVTTIDFSEFEL